MKYSYRPDISKPNQHIGLEHSGRYICHPNFSLIHKIFV